MTTVRGWGGRGRRAAVAVRSTTVEMSATSEGEKKNGPEVLVAGGGIAGRKTFPVDASRRDIMIERPSR